MSPENTGAVFRDTPFTPEMVVIPAGRFWMGTDVRDIKALKQEYGVNWFDCEHPRHEVTIPDPFAMGRYAVTFAEWDAFAEDTGGYKPDDEGWGRGNRPVINVSWKDAQQYVKWLSEKNGEIYRLPTEAEWEYACRAGTDTPFWTGSTISTVQANHNRYREKTVPVDSFVPNPFGLYQMHGNVCEWVEDCFQDSYISAPADGSANIIEGCDERVLRGGSWEDMSRFLRSTFRFAIRQDIRFYEYGFRVVRSLPSSL